MALGYLYQDQYVLIGTKSGTTITPVTLFSAYDSAGLTKTLLTQGMAKVNLNIVYTLGANEANNNINLRVDTSPDGTNFYQIMNESVSSGTSTMTQREFTFAGVNTAGTYQFSIPLDVQDKYMRFSFKETNQSSAFGTAYVEATLSGAK